MYLFRWDYHKILLYTHVTLYYFNIFIENKYEGICHLILVQTDLNLQKRVILSTTLVNYSIISINYDFFQV